MSDITNTTAIPPVDALKEQSPIWAGIKNMFKRFETGKFLNAFAWGVGIGTVVDLGLEFIAEPVLGALGIAVGGSALPFALILAGTAIAAGVAAGVEDMAKETYHRVTTSVKTAREHNRDVAIVKSRMFQHFKEHEENLSTALQQNQQYQRDPSSFEAKVQEAALTQAFQQTSQLRRDGNRLAQAGMAPYQFDQVTPANAVVRGIVDQGPRERPQSLAADGAEQTAGAALSR